MRLFIAIAVPAEMQKRLNELGRIFAEAVPSVRPVRSQNIHLTLHFLGEHDHSKVKDIVEVVDDASFGTRKFEAGVSGLGSFGRRGSPSVLWAGVEEVDELVLLHSRLGDGLRKLSIQVDDRPFFPHLTFARVKPGRRVGRLSAMLESAGREFGVLEINAIALVSSELNSEGAEYEILHSARLGQ